MKVQITASTVLTTTLSPIDELEEKDKLFLREGRWLGVESAVEHPSLGRTKIHLINPVNGCKNWWAMTSDISIESEDG